MTANLRTAALALLLLTVAGCASTTAVNPHEPRRLVGTESDVRLDAEILTDSLSFSQQIPISYVITNNRSTAIAIAELVPESSYDADSRVVTVSLGTEVPGQELLPRLAEIGPGQKKSFSTAAHVTLTASGGPTNPYMTRPNGIQLKLNFLTDPQLFDALIGIPERAVHDPKLADELFPKWLEKNESLFTNILPMRWFTEPDGASRGMKDVRRP